MINFDNGFGEFLEIKLSDFKKQSKNLNVFVLKKNLQNCLKNFTLIETIDFLELFFLRLKLLSLLLNF